MFLIIQIEVLICVLQISYSFNENDYNDEYKTMAPSINNIEYTTIPETYDGTFNSQFLNANIEEFSDQTTDLKQVALLLDEDLKSIGAYTLTVDSSIDNFLREIKSVSNLSDELQDNEIGSEDPINTPSVCNTTDQESVQNLKVDSVDTEWISLSWYPCKNTTDQSLMYFINICANQKCFQTIEKETHHNATNLNPCTEYTFTVKASDKNTEPDEIGQTVSAKTNNTNEIGEIRNLLVNSTIDSIYLSWKEPAKYSTCVLRYLITQCSKDTCNDTSVSTTEYISNQLEPCKEYFFTVKAATKFVWSNGVNATVKTHSPKPSAPRLTFIDANAFSLSIQWKPPIIGAICIKHYRVTISPQSIVKQLTGTNITILGLCACTSYSVYINAVDEDNNDGNKTIIPTGTKSAIPISPALNILEPFPSINKILFSWKLQKSNNNCTLTSLNVICNHTTSGGHGYEPVNGTSETHINSKIQDEFLIVNSTIENISPYTTYVCSAYVTNEAGSSNLSDTVEVTTLEDKPSPPVLNVLNVTQSDFTFVWERPKYLAGNLYDFEITFKWQENFPVPNWCPQESSTHNVHLNGSTFTFVYLGAKAFTKYTAKIKAKTAAGWGNYSENVPFETPAAVPGMVSNFSFFITNNADDANTLDTILTWGLPCTLNGMIDYFNVSVYGTRFNYSPHSFTIKKYIPNIISNNDIISINLNELRAEYNYTFNVSTKVIGIEAFGMLATWSSILYPAGIPSQPDEDYLKSITIDPSTTRRSTTTATLLLPLFPDINGDIIYYSIIVAKINYNIASSSRFSFKDHSWPNISSWEESMFHDFVIPYQATRLYWNPYPNYVADYGDMKAVKYTLGEDTNCKEISSNTHKRVFCNGPLKPNTWYHVRMRAFTHDGYADSKLFLIKTNAQIDVGLVTGVVFGILFLGVLTTMMLLVRKCSPQVILHRFLHSDMTGSPVPTPFSKKKFISHCQQLIDNPGKLSNEFQLLQTLSVDLQMPTNTACLQANKKKNRYSDILPYDFSRVKLKVIDNDPNTDYINASFIKGYSSEDEYIACQGPKEETTFDFWRMVEQYNVNMIIMLTELIEKGKEKCHQYFPTIRETFRYENMSIRCTSELDYRSYTQRTLVLQKENKKRTITHLHFKDWLDHDVPEDFDPMIHFCQVIRRNILANKGYIVIHCSAGIGRTGTLIAIDILLQQLRDNKKLDVFGTVYRLRHNRINMVQKESQYAYIYNCIKQVLRNPYCLKTYKPPPVDPVCENATRKMKIILNSNTNTNLVNNFEMYV